MFPVLSGFVFAAEQNLIGKRRALRRSGAHKCPVRMQKRPETRRASSNSRDSQPYFRMPTVQRIIAKLLSAFSADSNRLSGVGDGRDVPPARSCAEAEEAGREPPRSECDGRMIKTPILHRHPCICKAFGLRKRILRSFSAMDDLSVVFYWGMQSDCTFGIFGASCVPTCTAPCSEWLALQIADGTS